MLSLALPFEIVIIFYRSTLSLSLIFAFLTPATSNAAALSPASPIVQTPPASDFGSPPSGEIPILYNDRTVYATPDLLKQGRVLAALARNGQIYVPLQSMFEQMGATVTISADGMTIGAAKSGVTVSVTAGRNEFIVNGEHRPLDVPPMFYHGVLLAPVRVLSEALGAYVQWVADKRVVVVRYIPVTPPPAAPVSTPTPIPAAVPTATPTPAPAIVRYYPFAQFALTSPKNYNEFTSGQHCDQSYLLSLAYPIEKSGFAVKVDYRQDAYVTNDTTNDAFGNEYTGFRTIDGGYAYAPVFLGKQYQFDARLEYQVVAPQFYIGLSYEAQSNNYGYPHLSAVGGGIEKLPALHPGLGFYGSYFYYPNASGNYTVTEPASSNDGATYRQQYEITTYDVGLTFVAARFPIYLFGGYAGNQWAAKQNAPIGQTHNGPYAGLGVKL
jgi:hypothetical protein